MSLINGASGTGAQTGTSGNDAISQALGGTELGQMFTKLLVAQVQYQDPLEPTDSSTFITQLTQLSQTESLQSLNSQLSTQSSILDSLQTMQLGSQVGSTIMVTASSVQLDDMALSASVTLPATADLTLELTAADGKVTKVNLGSNAVGDAPFSIDPTALGLPAGKYDIAVKDASGTSYPIEVAGTLQSVRMTATGAVALQVQGLGDVLPSRVTRFLGQKA